MALTHEQLQVIARAQAALAAGARECQGLMELMELEGEDEQGVLQTIELCRQSWQELDEMAPKTHTLVQNIRHLLHNGNRNQIITYLKRNDPNGCYTDDDCDAERWPHLTLEGAREHLRMIINDMTLECCSSCLEEINAADMVTDAEGNRVCKDCYGGTH